MKKIGYNLPLDKQQFTQISAREGNIKYAKTTKKKNFKELLLPGW